MNKYIYSFKIVATKGKYKEEIDKAQTRPEAKKKLTYYKIHYHGKADVKIIPCRTKNPFYEDNT